MKLSHSLGLSAFSLCAGLAIASGGFANDTGKIISMLGMGALPASFITYFVADTKSQRLLNDAESKNEEAGKTLHKVIKEFDNCKSSLATVNSQLESLKLMPKAGVRLKLAPRNLQTGPGPFLASLVNEQRTGLRSLTLGFSFLKRRRRKSNQTWALL